MQSDRSQSKDLPFATLAKGWKPRTPSRQSATANPHSHRAISINMSLDGRQFTKPIRKLTKALKNTTRRPTPDEVHEMRTQTRRLEATISALRLNQDRDGVRILKEITPIRKRAGKVRDMDVLTGFASTLSNEGQDECLIQLLTYLGALREKSAGKLSNMVARKRKKARRDLEDYSALISKHFRDPKQTTPQGEEWKRDAVTTALQLSGELASWPRLDVKNLHSFRLKVKQLGYTLKLADDSESAYLGALVKTKDAIGEWHDWTELRAIADKVIGHREACPLRKEIDSVVSQKLAIALSAATRLRKNYLETGDRSNKRTVRSVRLNEPVLVTAAKLGA